MEETYEWQKTMYIAALYTQLVIHRHPEAMEVANKAAEELYSKKLPFPAIVVG